MEFKTEPFQHQRETLQRLSERPENFFAVLWEQGTGKTKFSIDRAAQLWREGKIDAVLVVAPKGVDLNWMKDQLPIHLPDDVNKQSEAHRYQAVKAKTKWHQKACENILKTERLAWVFTSIDSFVTEAGKKYFKRFLKQRRVLYILDESPRIKTPKAKRTQTVVASGAYAEYPMILTGTLTGGSPFDAYSQMRFLDKEFWRREIGIRRFSEFKMRYGEWFTRAEAEEALGFDPGYDKLIRYKNLDELRGIIARHASRVRKADVLDLPEKLFSKRRFEMTAAQRRHYEELRDEFETELADGTLLEAEMALVRLLRLQQITCGYVAVGPGEPIQQIDTKNPRLEIMEELRDECIGSKNVVRARFQQDVEQVMHLLGGKAKRFDGTVSDTYAEQAEQEFKHGDLEWLVASCQKGTEGHDWYMSTNCIFYSSNFNLIDRLQMEDRHHRSGTKTDVNYIDLIAEGTVDEKIANALVEKLEIASLIQGDQLREWL